LTRRDLLAAIASAPLLSIHPPSPRVEFIEEPHLLSAESARGYHAIAIGSRWLIAPGIRDLTMETCATLLRNVRSGAWLLLESGVCFSPPAHAAAQSAILKQAFGLHIQPPINAPSCVTYSWPTNKMVRPFQSLTPVLCRPHEVIATYNGLPVCMKRTMGLGGIIYLGSMLGPGLMAEEREAHEIASALLHR
jgi:hypothetical protein